MVAAHIVRATTRSHMFQHGTTVYETIALQFESFSVSSFNKSAFNVAIAFVIFANYFVVFDQYSGLCGFTYKALAAAAIVAFKALATARIADSVTTIHIHTREAGWKREQCYNNDGSSKKGAERSDEMHG